MEQLSDIAIVGLHSNAQSDQQTDNLEAIDETYVPSIEYRIQAALHRRGQLIDGGSGTTMTQKEKGPKESKFVRKTQTRSITRSQSLSSSNLYQ